MLSSNRIAILLAMLDGKGSESEWSAIRELRSLGPALAPHLLAHYRSARSWKVRASCVYHSVRYARDSDDALQLGLEAVHDKAKVVRYRACMLLAYSLKRQLLPELRRQRAAATGPDAADLDAAIDAIECQNHNYFVDRDHSGQMTLTISDACGTRTESNPSGRDPDRE